MNICHDTTFEYLPNSLIMNGDESEVTEVINVLEKKEYTYRIEHIEQIMFGLRSATPH